MFNINAKLFASVAKSITFDAKETAKATAEVSKQVAGVSAVVAADYANKGAQYASTHMSKLAERMNAIAERKANEINARRAVREIAEAPAPQVQQSAAFNEVFAAMYGGKKVA